MGSIIRYARPHPRRPPVKISAEQETLEARRSLFILTSSFLVVATVMCAAVVVMVARTWTGIIIMSAFVLVFALLKIVLANALIFAMLRYDAATADVPVRADAVRGYRRVAGIRQTPAVKGIRTGTANSNKLRVATRNAHPGSS
jgi:hypothetical protein